MGIIFVLAVTNHAEKNKLKPSRKFIAQGIFVIFMALYYFIPPQKFSTFELTMRIVALDTALVFFTIFLPYYRDKNLDAFWQYTKTLFLRLMTTYLFTMILYAGLSLALFALDVLFGVDVDGKLYLYLFIILCGIFAPVFFAGGLSSDYSFYEKELLYPKALKFLVQNILVPLVILYMLILYVYAGKIIVLWQFPKGWVTNLVLSFSIPGLISFFLIYPLKDSGNKFISGFFRLYFWLMLPLILLLFIAIFKRVNAYGITELRYYVIIIAAWLAFISVYFIINKHKNLKIIAVSFFILAVISSFGPWGAFSISRKSQIHRFEKLLTENNMLVDGKFVKPDSTVKWKAKKNIASIVSYITRYHDANVFQKYFTADFDTLFTDNNRYSKESALLNEMGLDNIPYWEYINDEEGEEAPYNNYVYFSTETPENVIDISNYDVMIKSENYFNSHPYIKADTIVSNTFEAKDFKVLQVFDINTNILSYFIENENANILKVDLNQIINNLIAEYPGQSFYNIPMKKLQIIKETDLCNLNFQILSISCNRSKDNKFTDINLNVRLMLRIKRL